MKEIVKGSLCCSHMEEAFSTGTDNEGFGPLAHFLDDGIYFGTHDESIRYCPWCGTEINGDVSKEMVFTGI